MSTLSKISFRALADEIEEVCAWLSGHGLRISPSRIGTYKKHINEMADYYDNDKVDQLLELRSFHELVNSSFEANELRHIYKGLNNVKGESLTEKLLEINKGPFIYTEENTSSTNRARNIAFELNIAARLIQAGYEVDLSDEADLIVKDSEYEVYIECKRPQKEHQINSNIKGALKQLHKRYGISKSSNKVRGLIAISIVKVFNPELYLLVANTPKELIEKVQKINITFIEQFKSKWRTPDDKKTIGAIIHVGCPFEIKKLNLLTNCNQYDLYCNDYIDTIDEKFLHVLVDKMSASFYS